MGLETMAWLSVTLSLRLLSDFFSPCKQGQAARPLGRAGWCRFWGPEAPWRLCFSKGSPAQLKSRLHPSQLGSQSSGGLSTLGKLTELGKNSRRPGPGDL